MTSEHRQVRTEMNFETLIYEEENEVGVLSFNRPKAMNALNGQLISEFSQFIEKVPVLKGLILTGVGEKAFVAGADIKEIAALNKETAKAFVDAGQVLFNRLESLSFPVIAAVNGFALGGGCEVALACDFILASETASFGLPEVGLGLLPGYGGTQRLSRAIGLPRAKEMIYTGNVYKVDQAFQMGLVNRVVKPEDLMNEAKKTCETFKKRSAIAISMAKRSIHEGFSMTLQDGCRFEKDCFISLFDHGDVKEGTTAFIEKRKPTF
jgi:enoyl-CoA hydratase